MSAQEQKYCNKLMKEITIESWKSLLNKLHLCAEQKQWCNMDGAMRRVVYMWIVISEERITSIFRMEKSAKHETSAGA
jgi:hypothetical protein